MFLSSDKQNRVHWIRLLSVSYGEALHGAYTLEDFTKSPVVVLRSPVAHPTSALVFFWNHPAAIEMTPNMKIPQFKLEMFIPDPPKVLNYSTGEAGCHSKGVVRTIAQDETHLDG